MRKAGKDIRTYISVRPMKINSFLAFEESVLLSQAKLDEKGREGHRDLHFGQTYENV
jgi:hypothetical protein